MPYRFHFDLKATLAGNQNPQIDLQIPVFDESSQSFLKAVDSYKNRAISVIADKRAKDTAEIKKSQERIQKLETETNNCKVHEIELMATQALEKEQEERKDAEITVAAFKRLISSLHERTVTMQAQIDEYHALAANLRAEKGKERETLNSHASKAAPELEVYETLLACTIKGMEQEQLLITFKCADMSDMNREFSFILDVSGSHYKIIKASPPVPSLPLLVDKLNITRDIYAFIVQIQQKFHRLANEN